MSNVRQMFPDANVFAFSVIRGGEKTVQILVDAAPISALEERAREIADTEMKKGNTIEWKNGDREWIRVTSDFGDDHELIWSETADDRIRCSRVHVTRHPDGTRTEKYLGRSWRLYATMWDD